ncbi:Crp/Fnr family transcriptional regulator [Thermaurantiacus sp.]
MVEERAATFPKGRDVAGAGWQALSANGWLARCPDDFRKAMLDAAIFRLAPRGQTIIRAGEEMGGLVAIAHGTAEITLYFDHPDTAFVHLVHAGYWAGYRPLIGRHRLISITARGDLLWALVPRHAVQQMLDSNPRWWRHLLDLADDNVELTVGIIADLTRQNSLQRVLAVLLRLGGCRTDDPPPDATLTLSLSQADLAGMAVMSRNTLNAILQELEERGLIQLGYRSVTIREPRRLRTLLDD